MISVTGSNNNRVSKMAPSPLVSATLQSAVLSATSNLLAQAITAYRTDVGNPFQLLC